MHSFPQFTRSTLCEEFPGVGAIRFGGNFMVRGQFSSAAIVLERLTFTTRMVSTSLILKETVTCHLELDVSNTL